MKPVLYPVWRLCGTAASAVVLAACGGGSALPDEPPDHGGNGGNAQAVSQPGELTSYVQGQLRALDAQGRLLSSPGADAPTATAVGMPSFGGAAAAPPARSATLVQEEGVDEADLIQTDGRHLYTVWPQPGSGPRVTAYERAADGRAVALSSTTLASDGASDVGTDGMVLSADARTLAVVSQHWTATAAGEVCREVCMTLAPVWMRSSVDVQRVDVGNPAALSAGERVSIDGFLVDSRRIGDALYLVTTHRPVLPPQLLPATATAGERAAAIARLSAAELLPRMRRNGGASQPLLADTDCYVQAANASTAVEFTTITVFDLRSPTLARKSRCIVGGSEALYMSPTSLYVATTRWSYTSGGPVPTIFPPQMKTDIHKFALADGTVAYRASGQVDGHLGWDRERKPYRLSEHNGDLRVLSFTGQSGWFTPQDAGTVPASPALLTVLRERAGDRTLQPLATLPNAVRSAPIGKPGEQVHAVRFLGDRGYVVTFRRTDPLYLLDLSDPADPKATGELQVAGFSDYLYPLPGGLLLGAGHDADAGGRTTGLKIALFDVADPTQPSQRASLTLGSAGSSSALDGSRHGLNMMIVNSVARVALPVNLSSAPFAGWQRGLQRLEVDLAARTLRDLGLAGRSDGSSFAALALERGAQIGDTVYYLSAGALSSHAW